MKTKILILIAVAAIALAFAIGNQPSGEETKKPINPRPFEKATRLHESPTPRPFGTTGELLHNDISSPTPRPFGTKGELLHNDPAITGEPPPNPAPAFLIAAGFVAAVIVLAKRK